MGAPLPHHGRSLGPAVGLVGALRVVVRVAPDEIRPSIIRSLWAINAFIVTTIALGLTWIAIAGDRLSEDAFAAIALGSVAVAAVGGLSAAVVVRRRVVRHMRWGFGGGFNRSSQRAVGGAYGASEGLGFDDDGAAGDAFPGPSWFGS